MSDNDYVKVPKAELAKLEQAREELYNMLPLGEAELLKLTNVTGQIWRVANTKNWAASDE